jgi:hypothetical protein
VEAQTETRTQQLSQEIDRQRAEMLDHLTAQRDELSTVVRDLRAFESAYRSNLEEHFRQQISMLSSGSAEPVPAPDATPAPSVPSRSEAGEEHPAEDGEAPRSETPRLDALLGDQHRG